MGKISIALLTTGAIALLALPAGCGAPNDTRILVEDLSSPTPAFQRDEDRDGVTVLEGDCDDTNPSIYPVDPSVAGSSGAPEGSSAPDGLSGDGIDNNCNGIIDEGTLEFDDDRDGYSELTDDCDDSDAQVHPSKLDGCDGLDNDCDGYIDEDAVDSYEPNDTANAATNVGDVTCGYTWREVSAFPAGDVDYFQMRVRDASDTGCNFTVTAYLYLAPSDLEFSVTLYKLEDGALKYLDAAQSSEDYYVDFKGSSSVDDTGDYVVEVREAAGYNATTCRNEVMLYLEGF